MFNAGGKDEILAVSGDSRDGTAGLSIAHSTGRAAWKNAILPVEPGKRHRVSA